MMKTFAKRWNGVSIEDDGVTMSKEAKSFATCFRNMLKRHSPHDFQLKFWTGHYYLAAFIVSPSGKTVYISYSIPRYGRPVNFYDDDPIHGVLIRYARNDHDFSGGQNYYCSIYNLPLTIANMMII